MRIALVQLPPMPIGPLTLAAVAAEMGVDVELLDLPPRRREEDFLASLRGVDAVGFSTVCTTYPRTLLLAKRLKARSPSTVIVLGGPQASITYAETLTAWPWIDLVIRGEAEHGFASFLEVMQSRHRDWSAVPGAAWRGVGGVHTAPLPGVARALDTLPFARYERQPNLGELGFAMVEVGRGCPYACTFCCTNTYFNRTSRMKSPERILAEIQRVHALCGVRRFEFLHDMFTYDQDTVRAICRKLDGRGFSWGCSSRTDTLTPSLLDSMGAAGCTGFYFGIETGSPRLQTLLKKNLDVQEAFATVREVRRRGFRATVSIIVGFPHETPEDLRESLLLATALLAEGVDSLQLPVWGPLAHTPLTSEWTQFDYDGAASNFTDTDGMPNEEETALIKTSFELFSTFWRPVGTAIERRDYVVMTAAIESLADHPSLRRYLVEAERVPFVDFLVGGGYGAALAGLSGVRLLEGLLARYAAARGPRGDAAVRLLQFDTALRQFAHAPEGTIGHLRVGALEAGVILAGRHGRMPALGEGRQFSLAMAKTGRGVGIAIERLA